MSDRALFRSLVVEALMRVHGLPLETALGALDDRGDDPFDCGLPAEDAAHLVAQELNGERRYAPRGAR